MSLLVHLEQRRLELARVAENSARTARLTLIFHTSGHGELKVKEATKFGMVFLEQPIISTGVSLSAGRLVKTKFPNVCSGVHKWVRNERGYYVGAKLFFVVDSAEQSYELDHHITFEAAAIKFMPEGME